jgi:SAM-dependent methyltransferase
MNDSFNREREFHDEWAESVDPSSVDVSGSWTALATPETVWIEKTLGDVRGLSVLDLGCGLGEGAVHFAMLGANVVASDLSPGMLEVTKKVAELNKCNLNTLATSATDLSKVPDESFDIVYGANMLHHVNIEECISEVERVLKPGGRAAFWDPIAYNPIINVYRKMATKVRTDDEHPLKRADIRLLRSKFESVELRFFWLTATLIFVRFFLIDRIAPNEGRYWKLVIDRRYKHARFLRFTHALDSMVLKIFPPLRWWCWNIGVVVRKAS